jgi:capsular polysaccharide biosynthesis protein
MEDVLILPLIRTGKGQFVGGVPGRPAFQDLAIMRGIAPIVTPAADPGGRKTGRVGEAWFGGILFNHFGHFLLEGLARLSREVITSPLPILFYNPQRLSDLPAYAVATFKGIGVSPDRIRLIDEPVTVTRLHHVAPWFEIRRHVNVHDMDWIFRMPSLGYEEYLNQIVYLSRSRLVGRRDIASEAPLETAVQNSSGIVRFPELLSLQEQVALLRNCKAVAGMEGSAFHTCILAGSPQKRVVVCDRPPNLNFLLQDEILGGETIYLNRANQRADAVSSNLMSHLFP